MHPSHATPSTAEITNEVNNQIAGLGMIAFALFPFALPALALVVVCLLPVAVLGLLAGMLLLPFRLVRGVRRSRSQRQS
jgi:hypothetical protein